MKKIALCFALALSTAQLTGCSSNGSFNHIQSEMNTFGPIISKIRMVLPEDIDLKIDISSQGWNNAEAITINKITAVKADSMRKNFCYSITSENDTCEYGVQYLEPLPNKHFNSSLSLRNYTHLMSNLYNEKTRKWYWMSGFSRVNWPLWSKYKLELTEISSLAENYIALQKSEAYKLGLGTNFKPLSLPLEKGKEYTLANIREMLVINSTVESVNIHLSD